MTFRFEGMSEMFESAATNRTAMGMFDAPVRPAHWSVRERRGEAASGGVSEGAYRDLRAAGSEG